MLQQSILESRVRCIVAPFGQGLHVLRPYFLNCNVFVGKRKVIHVVEVVLDRILLLDQVN
jgi:hypothetical protein